MPSPFSLGINTDFELDDENKKVLDSLPPELQAVAKRGLAAYKSGAIPAEAHPALLAQGQQALASLRNPQPSDQPAGPPSGPPAMPTPMASPYGVAGGQIGPETQDQAVNERLAAQAKQQAANNEQATLAQFPGYGRQAQAAAVTPLSGKSNHQKLIDEMLNKASDTRPQGKSADEISAEGTAISNLPAVKRANQGLDDQENYLKMAMNRPLSPLHGDLGGFLAMGTKGWGADLGAGYKAPENATDQQARIMAALQKIQTDRQALAGNVVSGVKAAGGSGTLGDILTNMGKTENFAGANDPMGGQAMARMDRNARLLMSATHNDMTELNKANAATQEAQRMLASGTSVLDKSFLDSFLKSMIGGRVSNYDQMRQNGDTALADRAEQIMNSMVNGSFTPKNRAEYQDALRIIQEANAHEASARIADLKKSGMDGLGLPPERVDALLSVGHLGNFAPISPQTLATSAGKSAQTVGATDPNMTVKVIAPNGKKGTIPAANLKKAQAQGYKLIPGGQ